MKTEAYHNEEIVIALGFFDGVHLGHQELIKTAIAIAEKKHCASGVMTFSEHPLKLIFPAYTPWLITTNDQKVDLIKGMGIDYVFLNPFDDKLMKYSPEAFIRDYLMVKYDVVHIVVGFNYTFGYKGMGDVQMLLDFGEEYGFEVSVVPPCIIDEVAVSSTLIRELISTGRLDMVETYLGREYSIEGVVVEGKGLGHTYAIPTANLKMHEKVILPSSGVYYTKVTIGDTVYDGLTNLGFNPTFEKHPYSIETYIYDFDKKIYGRKMKLTFKVKTRGEMKFSSIEALFAQIRSDITTIDKLYRS